MLQISPPVSSKESRIWRIPSGTAAMLRSQSDREIRALLKNILSEAGHCKKSPNQLYLRHTKPSVLQRGVGKQRFKAFAMERAPRTLSAWVFVLPALKNFLLLRKLKKGGAVQLHTIYCSLYWSYSTFYLLLFVHQVESRLFMDMGWRFFFISKGSSSNDFDNER